MAKSVETMISRLFRAVLILLEEFNNALAPRNLRLGLLVEIRSELGESLELAELSQVKLGGSGHFLDRFGLRS